LIAENFIFYPDDFFIGDPGDYGMPFEEVYFPTADGLTLHGWFIPGEKPLTWLWFHGNAGNISYRLDNIRLLHHKLALNIFIFGYRGYGLSQGKPTEEGTYIDAEAALSYLHSRRDVDPRKIIFFGRSLGSAIAVDLATKHKCLGLILESPPTSLVGMMSRLFPSLSRDRLPIKYDSVSKINRINVPLLVLHGNHDEVVPYQLGKELFEAANEPKQFYTIENAGHNDTYIVGGEGYFAALGKFIQSLEAQER
jgi:fermentation-respiration switch protein FrsA (DUF1100 family)